MKIFVSLFLRCLHKNEDKRDRQDPRDRKERKALQDCRVRLDNFHQFIPALFTQEWEQDELTGPKGEKGETGLAGLQAKT